jgi:hypothetical protein
MAVWNGSWQPYALATNNKTNYSANDFASQFPNRTASQYPYSPQMTLRVNIHTGRQMTMQEPIQPIGELRVLFG